MCYALAEYRCGNAEQRGQVCQPFAALFGFLGRRSATIWVAPPDCGFRYHPERCFRGCLQIAGRFLARNQTAVSRVELHYCGASGKQLPRELLGEILDHGLLSHEAYQDLLRRCHLAYLPVSHPSHTVGRFSIPSRLADYLACGLPVIASTDPGSGIFSFLSSLPRGCAANVADTKALVQAVMAFAGDSVCWAEASAKAASYARQQLRVENVRAELFRQLDRC